MKLFKTEGQNASFDLCEFRRFWNRLLPILQHFKDLIERSWHGNRSNTDKYWDIHREMEVELHNISMS